MPVQDPTSWCFRAPPPALTVPVVALCNRLCKGRTPVYVPRLAVEDSRPHMCFDNVRTICDRHGGESVCGWVIWEWKDNFLEAEHHAVWSKEGRLFDVTPHRCCGGDVLFLSEPDRTYDFEQHRRVDNVRVALRGDAKVREYLDLSARFVALEEAHSQGREVALPPAVHAEHCRISERLRRIEQDLASWSLRRIGRNDNCWCGSGRKFKSCCRTSLA